MPGLSFAIMPYCLLADFVVVVHFLFVAFVVAGGLLVLRWPRVLAVHLPCAMWGALIELFGWVCPLTPLEKHLRGLGGEAGYADGFIERYIFSILYPRGLTRTHQIVLGILVLAVNAAIYGYLLWRRRSRATPIP